MPVSNSGSSHSLSPRDGSNCAADECSRVRTRVCVRQGRKLERCYRVGMKFVDGALEPGALDCVRIYRLRDGDVMAFR